MTTPDTRKTEPEKAVQPPTPEPKPRAPDSTRTPGDDAKHAVKTGLPPGVDVEDWKDPGRSLGGRGGSNNT